MALIPYSDSDEDSDQEEMAKITDKLPTNPPSIAISDEDEVIEVTTKPGINHQFKFKAMTSNKDSDISFDFGTTSTHKSLFDSLPMPKSKASSPQTNKKKRKKKKKKRKKREQSNSNNDKKRKREQLSLTDILPEPKHKKQKISPPPKTPLTSEKKPTSPPVPEDKIETNDIRIRQAEVHRKYSNPLASFAISSTDKVDNDEIEHEDEDHINQNNIQHIKPSTLNSQQTNGNGVEMMTASSIYKVGENNQYATIPSELPEYAQYADAKKQQQQIESEQIKNKEDDDIITIFQNDQLAQKNGKEWLPAFEIDDITRQEIKVVPTNTYNPETGKVEAVTKYTKTQRRKHQINTLAYEAQEKALQLAMRRAANYKTKAETQAKYGW